MWEKGIKPYGHQSHYRSTVTYIRGSSETKRHFQRHLPEFTTTSPKHPTTDATDQRLPSLALYHSNILQHEGCDPAWENTAPQAPLQESQDLKQSPSQNACQHFESSDKTPSSKTSSSNSTRKPSTFACSNQDRTYFSSTCH